MIKRIGSFYRRLFWSFEKQARYSGVKIGKNCRIATRYFGSEPYLIEIGDRVQITQEVRFFNHGGGWLFRSKDSNFDYFGKIKIGSNVYIGNCAIILPGVTIGDNVIVAAGTVVTRSVPKNSIIAGNPGKIVGTPSELEARVMLFNVSTKSMKPDEKRLYLLSLDQSRFIIK